MSSLDQRDISRLARAGISEVEARRQIALLRSPPRPAELDRACTIGDGIRQIADAERPALVAAWRQAAGEGRFSKFVPASGAASRMFSSLAEVRSEAAPSLDELHSRSANGDRQAESFVELLGRLPELPFYEELLAGSGLGPDEIASVASSDEYPKLLAVLLDPNGLAFSERPKGLIPFHRYPASRRTAFEEHLVEGGGYLRDELGPARIHFTVAEPQLAAFESAAVTSVWVAGNEVSFSTQGRSTQTLSLGADGEPTRTRQGDLLLRPGGHGALLPNLETMGGDLVYIKNIDNVLPESRQAEVILWQRLLGGLLIDLERWARRLPPPDVRPLRVCGMVRNSGEPGGGPFWVKAADGGTRAQIVESAEVDLDDPEQATIWTSSTHFNPVMLVTALRHPGGEPYRLSEHVDPQAVFLSHKPFEGHRIRVLEHPGLWNGAMADWDTVFVEVPEATFAPVKTVHDLLRPAHQGS